MPQALGFRQIALMGAFAFLVQILTHSDECVKIAVEGLEEAHWKMPIAYRVDSQEPLVIKEEYLECKQPANMFRRGNSTIDALFNVGVAVRFTVYFLDIVTYVMIFGLFVGGVSHWIWYLARVLPPLRAPIEAFMLFSAYQSPNMCEYFYAFINIHFFIGAALAAFIVYELYRYCVELHRLFGYVSNV